MSDSVFTLKAMEMMKTSSHHILPLPDNKHSFSLTILFCFKKIRLPLFVGVLGCLNYYATKNFSGHFLTSNRISCFLSLAANSCLASSQGFHMNDALKPNNKINIESVHRHRQKNKTSVIYWISSSMPHASCQKGRICV